MVAQEILSEVVTIPEAVEIAAKLGYPVDRSNLLRHAQTGRLIARKSRGAWLTTRSALQELIVELWSQSRGRPRETAPTWANFEMTPALAETLGEIDKLRDELQPQIRSDEEKERMRRELTIEAIYHTNHMSGNTLSLPEVRTIVNAFWAEQSPEQPLESA